MTYWTNRAPYNLLYQLKYRVGKVIGSLNIIRNKGFSMMQKAAMGYMLVVLAPMILDVLVDAMKGVV